jgi:small subunit ribosomal protein S16
VLKIRLQRVGRKNDPVFRLVAVDSHHGPKSGKFLEVLGSYDARGDRKPQFKVDRIKHWLSYGAQTSDTVHNLLISQSVIEGKKVNVLPKKSPIKKEKKEEGEKTEAPSESSAEEKPAETSASEEVKEEPKTEEVLKAESDQETQASNEEKTEEKPVEEKQEKEIPASEEKLKEENQEKAPEPDTQNKS